MKKILLTFASIASLITFNACNQRDVVTPAVVQQSNTSNGTRTFDFAMYVVETGTKGSAKAEGLSKIKVIAVQNGSIVTKETDENGLVIFNNLTEGNVNWYIPSVAGTNRAALAGTTLMSASSTYFDAPNHSNQKGTVSQIVKIPTLTASLKGKLVGDFDFDNKTPFENAAGVTVRLQYLPSDQASVMGTAGTSYHPEPNYYIVTTDANGAFTFNNVPALDNNTDISAQLLIETFRSYGSETFRFTTTATGSISAWLRSERVYDMGTVELTAANTNTASVSGVVFGDFAFLNKRALDANYTVNYESGSIQISNGTTLGFGSQLQFMDYVVVETTTLLGLVYNNLEGKPVTLVGSNVFPGANEFDLASYPNIMTVPGFSAADFLRQNTTIAGLTHYIRYNQGGGNPFAELVAASPVTYASLSSGFTSANALVRLNYLGSTAGPKEFVVKTGANGRFEINSIPSGNYSISMLFEGSFTMKDGYQKRVAMTSPSQRPNTFTVSISGTINLPANRVTDLGAVELK